MSSFVDFLKENWIWWVLPIVIVLALVGWILMSESTPTDADSPFQYDIY